MKKGVICVLICMLMILTTVVPVSAHEVLKTTSRPLITGNILYVGGLGPNNYTRIQDAVDNATDGDTVFVYDDSSPYYENIVINTSISLRGEDANTTIIDGDAFGDVVKITSDSVNLSAFTVRHGQNGIFLEYSHDCTITGNRILQTNDLGSGIILEQSHHNTIINNTVIECRRDSA